MSSIPVVLENLWNVFDEISLTETRRTQSTQIQDNTGFTINFQSNVEVRITKIGSFTVNTLVPHLFFSGDYNLNYKTNFFLLFVRRKFELIKLINLTIRVLEINSKKSSNSNSQLYISP